MSKILTMNNLDLGYEVLSEEEAKEAQLMIRKIIDNIETKDINYTYEDFIWKSINNSKDYNGFGNIPIVNERSACHV